MEAKARAQSPSPGESGARVGFLESIWISARASATASPRGMPTTYLLFAVLPEALGLALLVAFTGCFLAAGFIVGFFAAGFLAGAECLTAGLGVCLIGSGTWCLTGAAWLTSTFATGFAAAGGVEETKGFLFACDASTSRIS